jgi:uncharacterized membrane protein YgaE (UPF0421/DUF939 family)
MAKWKIGKGTLQNIGREKVGMTITFSSEDKREVTNYHEIESVDKDVIEQELQKTANEFEAREQKDVGIPDLTENKFISVDLKESVTE